MRRKGGMHGLRSVGMREGMRREGGREEMAQNGQNGGHKMLALL